MRSYAASCSAFSALPIQRLEGRRTALLCHSLKRAPATKKSDIPIKALTGLFAFWGSSCVSAAHQIFQNCPLVEKRGLPLAGYKRQNRNQIALQYDRQFRAVGHDINAADKFKELVCGKQLLCHQIENLLGLPLW